MKLLERLALSLILVVALASAALAQGSNCGQVTYCKGSITANGDAITVSLPQNTNTGTVTVAGTFSGTLQFEQTNNGSNWVASTGTPPSGPGVTSTTSAGSWAFSIPSLSGFRVRASAFASGTAVLTVTNSTSGGGSGGGAVSSVFGRTGAVAAQTGDYTLNQMGDPTADKTFTFNGSPASQVIFSSSEGSVTIAPFGTSLNLNYGPTSGDLGGMVWSTTIGGAKTAWEFLSNNDSIGDRNEYTMIEGTNTTVKMRIFQGTNGNIDLVPSGGAVGIGADPAPGIDLDVSSSAPNGGTLNVAKSIAVGTSGAGTISGLNNIYTGTASNTDLAGSMTASGGTATYAFTGTYTSAPICIVQDDTTIASLLTKTVSTTTLTVTTTGATDAVSYICSGRN